MGGKATDALGVCCTRSARPQCCDVSVYSYDQPAAVDGKDLSRGRRVEVETGGAAVCVDFSLVFMSCVQR